jgi:hypothetical protein
MQNPILIANPADNLHNQAAERIDTGDNVEKNS